MKFGTAIESLGVYLPEEILTTQAIEDRLNLSVPLKLEFLSGIKERRRCSPVEDCLTLASNAATDCMRYSTYTPAEIEMVIFCSISKYVGGLKHIYEPAISVLLREQLGCYRATCFDLSNACAGMLTGVHVGSDFIERGVVKNCLVVSGEYITSLTENAIENITTRLSPEVASLTLGDSGAAILLSRTIPGMNCIEASRFITLGCYSELCMANQSKTQSGGVMQTQMKEIHEVSIQHAPRIIEEALSEASLTLDQIDFLIPHQTSKLAISAGEKHFADYFGSMARHVVNNLDKVGNTASTSHILALYRLLHEKQLRKGDRVMLLSFASGLVIGVVIVTIEHLLDQYGRNH